MTFRNERVFLRDDPYSNIVGCNSSIQVLALFVPRSEALYVKEPTHAPTPWTLKAT